MSIYVVFVRVLKCCIVNDKGFKLIVFFFFKSDCVVIDYFGILGYIFLFGKIDL